MRWQPFQNQPPFTSQTRVLKHVNGERYVQYDGPRSPKPTRKARATEEPPSTTELESLRTRCSKMGAAGATLRLQLSQAREEAAQARRDVAKGAAAFEQERATLKKEADATAAQLSQAREEATARHEADAETIARLMEQLAAPKAVGEEAAPSGAPAENTSAEKARHVSFAAAPADEAAAPMAAPGSEPVPQAAAEPTATATDDVDAAVVVSE